MKVINISEEQYVKLLEDCEAPCKGKHCFYRKYLEAQHPSIYIVVQVKMMEMMKWIWSNDAKFDVGWKEVETRWIEQRYAEAYFKAFEKIDTEKIDDINVDKIFRMMIEFQTLLHGRITE